MKIIMDMWQHTPGFFDYDKRGEERIMARGADALIKNGQEIFTWPLADSSVQIDGGLFWLVVNEVHFRMLQSFSFPKCFTYANDLTTPQMELARQKNITPACGINTTMKSYLSPDRERELLIWQNELNNKRAAYLPFPLVENVGTKSNFYSNDFVFPARWVFIRGEKEYVGVVNILIDILSTSPGGLGDNGKIYFPCDLIANPSKLSPIGQKLYSDGRIITKERTPFPEMLSLLSNAKMSFGLTAQGGSQYEAVMGGALPMVWQDSFYWPTFAELALAKSWPILFGECRLWRPANLRGVLSNILANENFYLELMSRYRQVLQEHTYESFVNKFIQLINK